MMRMSILWITFIVWTVPQNDAKSQANANRKKASAVDSILTKHKEAAGGKAIQDLESLYAKAQAVSPRGSYVTELFSMGKSKLLYRQTGPGSKQFNGYVIDTLSWSYDKDTGRSKRLDDTTAWVLRGHEFQIISLFVDELYQNAEYAGRDSCGNFSCAVITAYDRMIQPTRLFFRDDNGFLACLSFRKPYGEKEMIRVVFNEWREADGLTIPSKVTITDNSGDYILNFTSFEINTLQPEFFAIPKMFD